MSQFLGITREPVFSPGKEEPDRAILVDTAQRLAARGHAVQVVEGTDPVWPEPPPHGVVFTMCQGDPALDRLAGWEARGVRIVNRPDAILNCQRHRTIPLLATTGLPFPETVVVDCIADLAPPPWMARGGAWVKRGDVHATEEGDVVRVQDKASLRRALDRFRARGIRRAAVQRHVPGVVLKFYAVRDGFFRCVPPDDGRGVPAPVLQQLDDIGRSAAAALGVEIYGGDGVWDERGGVTLIDLNDWPSYGRCRDAAAQAIAAYLQAQAIVADP
jgi:glutathione synthase/RimK-type ligase-like ATP-grasp enzyme